MVTITGMSKQFGQRLQEAINRAGMTKYRLAKETGISQVQIGRLVSGDRDATPDAVQVIAPILGIPIEEMQAWADADRLGDDGLARLRKYFLSKQEEAHEVRTRFAEKQGYMELNREELERLSQLPADHPDRAKIPDLQARNEQLKAELRAEVIEVDRKLDEIIALRDSLKGVQE